MNSFDKDAIAVAYESVQATSRYTKAFRQYVQSFMPLSDDEFWDVMGRFMELFRHGDKLGREPTKWATRELLRSHLFDGKYTMNIIDREEVKWGEVELERWKVMAQFYASYRDLKHRLSRKLDPMPGLERGDDAFGDLVDAMPLAGREVCQGIMEDDIANYKQLKKAIEGHVPKQLQDTVLHGENYVEMKLCESLESYFKSVASDIKKEEEPDEED